MKTWVCEMFGIDVPLFAFSHCRDVVAAVSRAGGFGVLGATTYKPDELDLELAWIDAHVGGKPYGVDLIIPEAFEGKGERLDGPSYLERIPLRHWEFVKRILDQSGVDSEGIQAVDTSGSGFRMSDEGARALLDVAFEHPIKLIANALGVPPRFMIERAHQEGIPVGALVGGREHAIRQVQAGVDLLIAQSYEAGGHTGVIGGMVLVPEVIEAIKPLRAIPVLAAGGIVTGRQMAAALCLGADGVWTGSVWLTTYEAETALYTRQKLLVASARDTIRSRARTGKPSRQLRTSWHDLWESEGSPGTLPMPLQGMLTKEAFHRIDVAAANGNPAAQELASYYVGQGVGLMTGMRSADEVVFSMLEEFVKTVDRLTSLVS